MGMKVFTMDFSSRRKSDSVQIWPKRLRLRRIYYWEKVFTEDFSRNGPKMEKVK